MQEVVYSATYFGRYLLSRGPECTRSVVSGIYVDVCDGLVRLCYFISRGRVKCLVLYSGCHAALIRIMSRKTMQAVLAMACPQDRLVYTLSTNNDAYINRLADLMRMAGARLVERSLNLVLSSEDCMGLYSRLSLAAETLFEGKKASLLGSHLRSLIDKLGEKCGEEGRAREPALEARAGA